MRSRMRSVAFFGLAGFHALLLWQRVLAGTILGPAVLTKYAGALVLLVAWRAFQHFAGSRARDHRALLIFGLFVVLLHAVPVSDAVRDLDAELVTVVEVTLAVSLTVAFVVLLARAANNARRVLCFVPIDRVARRSSRARIPLPARAPPAAR